MHCAFLSSSDSTFAGSVIPKGEVIIVIIAVIINDELFICIQMMFLLFISGSTLKSFLPSLSCQDFLDFLFPYPMLKIILHAHYYSL